MNVSRGGRTTGPLRVHGVTGQPTWPTCTMVISTPQQPDAEQGPSNGLGSSLPSGKTPTDILLIIFIHGYCVRSIYMRGHFLVTRILPVSKEMIQHLETFPRDYSISSQRMLRIWWLNLLSFRLMKCVSSRVFFLYIHHGSMSH